MNVGQVVGCCRSGIVNTDVFVADYECASLLGASIVKRNSLDDVPYAIAANDQKLVVFVDIRSHKMRIGGNKLFECMVSKAPGHCQDTCHAKPKPSARARESDALNLIQIFCSTHKARNLTKCPPTVREPPSTTNSVLLRCIFSFVVVGEASRAASSGKDCARVATIGHEHSKGPLKL